MKRDNLDVLTGVSIKDSTGRLITKWNVDCVINDGFQPLKYNVAFKPFGVTDKTSNIVYCRDINLMARYQLPNTDPTQFNITYRIGFNNKQYIINSILPYKRHLEIYLELVV